MKKWTDENGIPTVDGINAMSDAKDRARLSSEARSQIVQDPDPAEDHEPFFNPVALAEMEEQRRREEETERQRVAEGRRGLAARFAADPAAASRCVRILATLACEIESFWGASDIVRARGGRRGASLDEATTEDDLNAMCAAGLLEVEPRDDGDEDAPPTKSWGAYAIPRDAVEELVTIGAERWLARAASVESAP